MMGYNMMGNNFSGFSGYNSYNYANPYNNGTVPQAMRPNTSVDFQGSFVEGFDQVRSYPCPMSGVSILIDRKNNKLYLKSLDSTGQQVVEGYNLVDQNSQNQESTDNKQDSSLEDKPMTVSNFVPILNNIQDQLNKITESLGTKNKRKEKDEEVLDI